MENDIVKKEILRRNEYLKKFFLENDIKVSLLGEIENPLIVTDQNIVLSCNVHHYELIFKDDGFNGK